MDRNNPLVRQKGESPQAYRAFEEYLQDRRVSIAYSNFMLHNPDAITTDRTFVVWMEKYKWIDRARAYDIEREVETMRQSHYKVLDNTSTAEDISRVIFGAVLDEFDIRRSDMTDADMARFLKIAADINLKATKDAPSLVTVNVGDNSTNTVEVSDDVLRELGKRMSEVPDGDE